MDTADEHRPPLRDSAKSSSRADQIRQRVAVLSSSFRTLYLEWFARLSAQDFDEGTWRRSLTRRRQNWQACK
jgi:hypothetical protein